MQRTKKGDFFDAVQDRKNFSASKPKIKTPDYTPSLILDLQNAAEQFTQQSVKQPKTSLQPVTPNLEKHPPTLSETQLETQSEHSDTLSDKVSERHTDKQSDTHTDTHRHRHTDNLSENLSHTISETSLINRQIEHPRLSVQQTKVFNFLFERVSGFTTAKQIGQITGVPLPTVYISLRILRKLNIINYEKFQKGVRKGLTFIVDQKFHVETTAPPLDRFPTILKEIEKSDNYHRPYHTHTHTDDQEHEQSYQSQKPPFSSSSSLSKETTTNEIETTLGTHPELGYWRQKGLTGKQMTDWIKITGGLENLIQSLCYCRYDMVDLDQEQSKPISNVFNWFFKIIEKAGVYPKPKGYKSFADKQIEQERASLKEKERRIAELKALSRKKWELEREEAFWEMMADPESNLYRECYGNLNNFAKNLKGKVLESSMRSVFDKIMDEKDKGS